MDLPPSEAPVRSLEDLRRPGKEQGLEPKKAASVNIRATESERVTQFGS